MREQEQSADIVRQAIARGRSEGHFCSICHEDFKLRDTELGTMDTTKPWCKHIFCFDCLSNHKRQRIRENKTLECPKDQKYIIFIF